MKIRNYIESDWNKLCEIHDLARVDELKAASSAEAFLPGNSGRKRSLI